MIQGLLLLLACQAAPQEPAEPAAEPAFAPSSQDPAPPAPPAPAPEEPMNDDLTHLPVDLPIPCWCRGRHQAYPAMRADPLLAPYLDERMIPALQQPGPPERRLAAMSKAAAQARVDFVEQTGNPPSNDLDIVETDLRLALFAGLSDAIGQHSEASAAEKRAALEALLPLVIAEYPVGVPEDIEMNIWTLGARLRARLSMLVWLEKLEEEEAGG